MEDKEDSTVGLHALKILHGRILFLQKLVYDQNSKTTNFGFSALTLAAFEGMSGAERLSLLLRGCNETNKKGA